jgi:hypothetical protein
MSRNSRSLELQGKICELDTRYDGKKSFAPTSFCSAMSPFWERRHPYLCQIYRTGAVPRRDVGSLAVRRETIPIPDDVLAMLSPPVKQSLTIPDDVLFPKRKRGRPRNDALHRQATGLRCSLRHARRLLANGKPRHRERQPHDVIEALQARRERAAIVRQIQAEAVMSFLRYAIGYLRKKEFTANLFSGVDSRLAGMLVKHEKGLSVPVLIVSTAMGSKSLRLPAKVLGVSSAKLYRQYGSQLDDVRRRASELLAVAVVDWKKMANMKLPKRKRGVVSRPDSAWEKAEQTLFRQRYEHHDW